MLENKRASVKQCVNNLYIIPTILFFTIAYEIVNKLQIRFVC